MAQDNGGTIRVCGIAGSVRERSYNRALLRAAVELAPARMRIEIFDRLADIPLYNQDVEEKGDPEPVAALKKAIADADALLIATPEYNYGVPGVLKNAIDWASRPAKSSVLNLKVTALMGASGGAYGTVRAQTQLRSNFVFTRTPVVLGSEVLVGNAKDKFDEQLRLTDEATRTFVRKLLEALTEETRR